MSTYDLLQNILKSIPDHVTLVAVSKTKPVETIKEVYDNGYRVFGENKVQEIIEKYPKLPNDIQWHFIGHLQRNKVKFLVPFVHMIHSVDSLRLLAEINKQAAKIDRKIKCLLQFHIATEQSKFGLNETEVQELLNSERYKNLKNVSICGVMGMGTFTDDLSIVRKEFKTLKSIFNNLKTNYFSDQNEFKEISMGMTNDYMVAIEEGSTMIRVGSAIFGERNY